MSTESLFHNFVIDTPEGAERFVEAILLSEKDPPYVSSGKNKILTDPEEIRQVCNEMLTAARRDKEAKTPI